MKILLKLFSLKLIASILGLIYSIFQVRYFGASRTIEIYFAAQSLVYLVTSLTQSGQLAEVFLPEYHKLNIKKQHSGYDALNVVINRMLIYGSLLIFAVFIFAPFFVNILVPGFARPDKDLATLMFRVLLPYLYLQLMNSFFITVLNAEKKFGRAEVLGLTNSMVNILSLVLLFDILGIWALVVSLLLGKIIEFVFYFYQLFLNGYRYKPLLSTEGFDHRSFFQTMRSTFMYVGATQIYSFVLTASISFLPEGVFAVFKYVQNLANKISGLFVQPFLTIFFTAYSNLLHGAKAVSRTFSNNILSLINVNVITIIGSVLAGDLMIDYIWGGKKFGSEDVQLAYVFLLFNVMAILINSLGSIYRKMAVAHGKAKQLYSFWVIAQLLSAGFSYLLIRFFQTNGLFFIIPINAFLLGITSYLMYKTTADSEKFNFYNHRTLIGFGLVGMAVVLKYFLPRYLQVQNLHLLNVAFFILVFLMSLYPVFSTYKVLKHEENIG